jgi:hypothetical protein
MEPWAQRVTLAHPERRGSTNQNEERGLERVLGRMRVTPSEPNRPVEIRSHKTWGCYPFRDSE